MADQGFNPTQNQQVIALIAEATARPLEVVDGKTQTLQADMNAMRSSTEELMQKTDGVLKEMQQQAIDFRAAGHLLPGLRAGKWGRCESKWQS